MCLVLTLLAVPLARLRPRQGRYSRVWLAIMVYFVYSNLISAGKVWLAHGTMPEFLGLWWTHAAVVAAGACVHHPGRAALARLRSRRRHDPPRPLHRAQHPRLGAAGDGRAARARRPGHLHRSAGRHRGRPLHALRSACGSRLLNLPQQAYELLPITALIGSLFGLGIAGARQRAHRDSRDWRLDAAHRRRGGDRRPDADRVAVALGEVLAPPLQEAAKQQKAFSKFNNVSFGGGSGAWVRDGNLIINVARQSGAAPVRRHADLRAVGRSPACARSGMRRGATAGANRTWLLTDYTESRFTRDRVCCTARRASGVLKSNVTAGFLGLAVESPEQLTSRALWRLINYLQANSLSARDYLFAFWSRIARTVAILSRCCWRFRSCWARCARPGREPAC